MRPGRFKKNDFDEIYQNILKFNKIKEMKSKFPRTKIQMILTDQTKKIKKFFELLDIVDDVSVKQYTERGGNLTDLNEKLKLI